MDKRNSQRILHVLGSADRGGTETMTARLVSNMEPTFRNELCFLGKRGPIGEELEYKGFKVHYLSLTNPWAIPIAILRLYCLLRTNRYDILHLYGLKANFLGRILGRLSGHKKILGGLRSKYPSGIKKSWTLWLDRLTFGLSLGYVSNSQAAIDFLAAHGYDRRKFWLIHNGIDIEPFYERTGAEKEGLRRKYKVPLDTSIVTCVANLRHPKGHVYLIEALPKLREAKEDLLLMLVGEGPLRVVLEELVRRLGLSKNVLFLGSVNRDKIPEVLAITDVFVLPSLMEGLPTAVLEAMAAGCPVVATRVGGTPEAVSDGETGFLVEPRDPTMLAERIGQLLRDKDLRRRMGEAAGKRVEEHFSLDSMIKQYEALYKKLARQ